MIDMYLNRKARKVKGVDATLILKVSFMEQTINFGGGSAEVDRLEFATFKDFLKQKPTRSSGYGQGIIAFKTMMEARNG